MPSYQGTKGTQGQPCKKIGAARDAWDSPLCSHIDTPGERVNLTEEQLQQGTYGIPWKRLGP
jgi:hypothetical protein